MNRLIPPFAYRPYARWGPHGGPDRRSNRNRAAQGISAGEDGEAITQEDGWVSARRAPLGHQARAAPGATRSRLAPLIGSLARRPAARSLGCRAPGLARAGRKHTHSIEFLAPAAPYELLTASRHPSAWMKRTSARRKRCVCRLELTAISRLRAGLFTVGIAKGRRASVRAAEGSWQRRLPSSPDKNAPVAKRNTPRRVPPSPQEYTRRERGLSPRPSVRGRVVRTARRRPVRRPRRVTTPPEHVERLRDSTLEPRCLPRT